MGLSADDSDLQAKGCEALSFLAASPLGREAALGAHAQGAVTQALRRFPLDRSVQRHGAWAIRYMLQSNGSFAAAGQPGKPRRASKENDAFASHNRAECAFDEVVATEPGLCRLVVGMLSAFPADGDIAYQACALISDIGSMSQELAEALGREGACESICSTALATPHDTGLQAEALRALVQLVYRSESNAIRAAMAGICHTLAHALRSSGSHDMGIDVRDRACTIMEGIAEHEQTHETLLISGALQTVAMGLTPPKFQAQAVSRAPEGQLRRWFRILRLLISSGSCEGHSQAVSESQWESRSQAVAHTVGKDMVATLVHAMHVAAVGEGEGHESSLAVAALAASNSSTCVLLGQCGASNAALNALKVACIQPHRLVSVGDREGTCIPPQDPVLAANALLALANLFAEPCNRVALSARHGRLGNPAPEADREMLLKPQQGVGTVVERPRACPARGKEESGRKGFKEDTRVGNRMAIFVHQEEERPADAVITILVLAMDASGLHPSPEEESLSTTPPLPGLAANALRCAANLAVDSDLRTLLLEAGVAERAARALTLGSLPLARMDSSNRG
ncbi:unnamed protein product, partial [Discosporangium mesarthrocarpum]